MACEQDLIRQSESHNIKVGVWPSKTPGALDIHTVRVVVVSATNAGTPEFYTWLKSLFAADLLSRIVFDEIQNFYTADQYRPCFNTVVRVMALGVPILGLSATLPHTAIPVLLAHLGLAPETVLVIRSSTERPEIRLRTRRTTLNELVSSVSNAVTAANLVGGERGIVFCNNVGMCEEISTLTGFPIYVGNMERAAKNSIITKWAAGAHQWIIATTALSEGVDYSQVRMCIHAGPADHATMTRQMDGRIGRDGKPSISLTLWCSLPPLKNIEGNDILGINAQHEFLRLSEIQCLRLVFSIFFDGKGFTCAAIKGAVFCDFCASQLVSSFVTHSVHVLIYLPVAKGT